MFEDSSSRLLLFVVAAAMTAMYTMFAYRLVLKRKPSMRKDLMKMFPVVLAVLASMLAGIIMFVSRSNFTRSSTFMSSRDRALSELSLNVAAVESKINSLQAKLEALPPVSDSNTVHHEAAIAQMKTTLTRHDEALKKFEGLVISEPEKLITLPLMQRDFQNLQNDISTVKERVNDLSLMITETAGQNRWVIGTLAFGMLALVLPVIKSVFTTSSKGQEQSE